MLPAALPIFDRRRMGVLLHPTSLPGPYGIGDLGPEARRFVDWLARAGATVWQVLPMVPPGGPRDDVPYGSWAALATSPQVVSLEDLAQDGLLDIDEAHPVEAFDEGWAQVGPAVAAKEGPLGLAVERLLAGHPLRDELEVFRQIAEGALWSARFAARKRAAGGAPWWQWPDELAARDAVEVAAVDERLRGEVDRWLARFFLAERQWRVLRSYARSRGIALMGDVPMYVLHDSADVWAFREGWRLDPGGQPLAFAGAPPDVFSADGQFWGAPLYDWARMAEDEYAWWRRRLAHAFEHFDGVRIDHFRAFSAFWEIPRHADAARDGRWVPGPGRHFFETVERHLGRLALCAEDLGTIDDDVRRLVSEIGVPGMKILQFAFGDASDNPYLPHNIPANAIVYPGNHDNDTAVGWWAGLTESTRSHVQHYLGVHGHDIAWDLNRAALSSAARLAVIQMQDLLSLEGWARMNDAASYARPVSEWRNWRWRLKPREASDAVAGRLRFLGSLYGRAL